MIDHILSQQSSALGVCRSFCGWTSSAPGHDQFRMTGCCSWRFVALIVGAAVSGSALTPVSAQDAVALETGAAIAADLFQFPPATPERQIAAATITQQLDRFDDARAFLRQLIDRQLTDNELRSLRQKLGAATFLNLSIDARMQPEARELLRLINAASQAEAPTAEQLQSLVQDLGQPGAKATDAVSSLLSAGDAAVPALLAADPQTVAGRVATDLLESRARNFRGGLLAQMESSDAATRLRILRLLGSTADARIALRLLRWQFSPGGDPAVSEASRSAIRRLHSSLPDATTAADAADLLSGKASELICQSGERFSRLDESAAIRELIGMNPRAEALAKAALLLQDALAIDPSNVATRRMAFVAQCAAADTSMGEAATAAADKLPEEILAALDTALELNHPAAAIELLRGLSRVSAGQLDLTVAGRVLRASLNSPDPRVRLLAGRLVNDQLPVEVSQSAVSRTLSSVAGGSSRPEVVIAGADSSESGVLRAVLEDAGYTVAQAPTGVEGFELAVSQMNCELFIVSAETWYWPLTTTVANLRADVRTRHTPIIVIGSSRFEPRVMSLAANYDGVRFITAPVGAETLQTATQQINVPDSIDTAIAHRNELWMLTLQRLELPHLVLTPADREIMKSLAR